MQRKTRRNRTNLAASFIYSSAWCLCFFNEIVTEKAIHTHKNEVDRKRIPKKKQQRHTNTPIERVKKIHTSERRSIERWTRKLLSGSLVISFYSMFHLCVVEVCWCQEHHQLQNRWCSTCRVFLLLLFEVLMKKKRRITGDNYRKSW